MEKFKYLDWQILGIVFFLICFGLISIYSATYKEDLFYLKKQIVFAVISVFVIFALSFVDYKKLLNLSPYIYIAGIVSLIFVKFFGVSVLGSKRWINIGIGTIQPSEFMKLIIILTVSHMLHTAKIPISWKDVLKVIVIVAIPFFLIYKQPDLGTAIAVMFPAVFIIFLAEIDKKYVIGALITLIVALPFIYSNLEDYQKKRIEALFHPKKDPTGTAYQLIQSKIAVGSGGLYGKGFLKGTQSKLMFLPEKHNDFIFASISEEWGFIVSLLIVVLFAFLSIKILIWGYKVKDKPAKFICFGVGGLIAFQSFVNIAMTVGFAPVVGITLPFLSYGGSSMLAFSMMIGVVMSIIRDYKESKFQL